MVFDHLPAIARPARPTAAAACGRRIGIGAKGHVVGAGRQGQIIGDGLIEEQAVVVGLKYGFVHSFSFKWGLHCKCARAGFAATPAAPEPPPRQPRGRCGLWIFERWPEFLCAVRRRCYRPGRRSRDAAGKRRIPPSDPCLTLPHCKCEGLASKQLDAIQRATGTLIDLAAGTSGMVDGVFAKTRDTGLIYAASTGGVAPLRFIDAVFALSGTRTSSETRAMNTPITLESTCDVHFTANARGWRAGG